jgi:drug/metabolite transporter (DMT)-like permease
MPVVGMLAGYFLFQEEIGLAQFGGALAIFCGVFLTTNADRVAYWVTGSTNSYARHSTLKFFGGVKKLPQLKFMLLKI